MTELLYDAISVILIVILICKVFSLENQVERYSLAYASSINEQYVALFHIYYTTMDNMLEAEVLIPPADYKGYRCDLIEKMFFDSIPDAIGKVKINLDDIRATDVFYGEEGDSNSFEH